MSKKTRKKKGLNKKIFLILLFIIICITIVYFLSNKSSKKTSNLEANIEYIKDNISFPIQDNQIFNNDVSLQITWDINEEGILTYPNNKTKTINKNFSLNQPGKYIINVGKTSKTFTIIEEKMETYASLDESTNTLKFKNSNNITTIEIDGNIFNIEDNNIPNEYIFKTKGRYTVTIHTITGKTLYKSYRIINNI